jgi:hypothetical protein
LVKVMMDKAAIKLEVAQVLVALVEAEHLLVEIMAVAAVLVMAIITLMELVLALVAQ